ncbi:MAG: hypothetical protein M3347_15260, partial [Armatimonadota bacterium]|nr:hypothetical protein [Armatimonadota bacterium]
MKSVPTLLVMAATAVFCTMQTAFGVDDQTLTSKHGGTLLQFDFNGDNPWPQASAVNATLSFGPTGTIDEAKSTQASGGLLLSADGAPEGDKTARLASGPLPIRNTEKDLGKLTLAFSLSASMARPVVVHIESLDANKQRTGGLETTIYPAAPDFYQRYALDLSTMQPAGAGLFQPADPFVQLGFEVGHGWPAGAEHELRVDNVHFASPAFYVSPNGDDKNDGRSETTAFANPQKAVDVAGPGDIILVMNGTYKPVSVQGGVASFQRGGTPAAWIVLKNYPQHKPLFFVTGAWAGVRVGRPKGAPSSAGQVWPTLCYIEVRGLHVRGEADVAKEKYPDLINKADPHTNG